MTPSARRAILQAATLIMLGNVASRLLGLVREQVIAALFGGGSVTDSFQAASTLPTLVYDFLIGGAIAAALVPVFSDYADEPAPHTELSRLASALLTLISIMLGVGIVALSVCAPQLLDVLAEGLTPAARADAITLTRLMLPATWFMALSGIFTALLYARQQFLRPAFVTAIYNVSIIVVALIGASFFGVHVLAIGVIVGAFMQVVLQVPALRGLRVRPLFVWSHPGLRRALQLYAPVAAGLLVSTIGVFIDRRLASQTGEGSLAAMRFATTIIQFPIGLVAVALSSAILPTLSRQATEDEGRRTKDILSPVARPPSSVNDFKATLALGIKLAMMAMIPAMVGMIVLREPLVRVLFERGNFSGDDSVRTALAFLAYAPQLPFVALDQLLLAAFYARKNTLIPNLVAVASLGCYLVVALSLVNPWGMIGLAFANAVQNSSHALILLALLWRPIGGLLGYGIGRTTLKICLASSAMGFAVTWALSQLVQWSQSMVINLVVVASLGGLVYALMLMALRVEEAWQAVALARARLMRFNSS
jgi:putative peptidoglycan lipid II flippase